LDISSYGVAAEKPVLLDVERIVERRVLKQEPIFFLISPIRSRSRPHICPWIETDRLGLLETDDELQ